MKQNVALKIAFRKQINGKLSNAVSADEISKAGRCLLPLPQSTSFISAILQFDST
jgi:hypothetical protein